MNSGSAVFSSASRSSASKLASVIAKAVEERFGVVTPVIVKSAAKLEAIVKNKPFPPPESEHACFLVAFALDSMKLQELHGLCSLLQPGERFAVNERAAYLHCAGGLLDSKVGEAILGRAGRSVTTRNWATVLKLLSLARESAA